MRKSTTANVLTDLIETLENGHRGYGRAASMMARRGRGDLAAQMRDLSAQRARMADELRDVAGLAADSTSDGGTLSGAMHRSWMALRDALTGNDPSAVLAAVEEGEDHAVDRYREAVRSELPARVRVVIERQAAGIKTAHDKVKALRDSNA